MPSINHLAVHSRAHHQTAQTHAHRPTVRFGMQPNPSGQQSAPQSPGCLSALASWFCGLFKRSEPVQSVAPPQMREVNHLLPVDEPHVDYQALAHIPRELAPPPLIRQQSGPVHIPHAVAHDEPDNLDRNVPIHILAERDRAKRNRQYTGLDIPFSPPDVAEDKRKSQLKFQDKV